MAKKILHIIDCLSYSGVTSYTVRLINSLPQYKHLILSCYNGNANKEIKNLNLSFKILLDKTEIKYLYLPLKYWKFVTFLFKNKFDIIHYHQGGVGLILLAVMFGKKAEVVHHLHSGNLIGDNSKEDISFVHSILLRFLSKYTHQLAVAEHVYNKYKLRINRARNLQLIRNAIPYNFRTKDLRSNTLGYIGRFTKEKGFPVFLSLASKLKIKKPELNILIKGEFFNTKNTSIEQIPSSFNVESFYKSIDLLLYLSHAPESLPLVILEAIAFDVGVIAYPLKGVVEILGDDYPLYVKNEDEVISKVSEYYSPEFDLLALSKIHKERSEKFNFANMINSIDNLYQRLIV